MKTYAYHILSLIHFVNRYERSKSLLMKNHSNWPSFTQISTTIFYELEIECVTTLWKTTKRHYKCTKFWILKVYKIDAMPKQWCCLQKGLIDSNMLIHPHLYKRFGFIWSWNKAYKVSLKSLLFNKNINRNFISRTLCTKHYEQSNILLIETKGSRPFYIQQGAIDSY
jgi:hypothetical protein